jgi:molybdenum cofactor cytidylyltransferase
VRHAVRAALQSRARPVVVVTGHQGEQVSAALAGLDVRLVANPDYVQGLSTSLKAGVAALPADVDGVLVCLGDMPRITADHLDRLISAFAPKESRSIAVPVHNGKRGNPVLFGRSLFAEILEAEGDTGAKHLIGRHADEVAEVDLGTSAIFVDVDTPDALARLKQT